MHLSFSLVLINSIAQYPVRKALKHKQKQDHNQPPLIKLLGKYKADVHTNALTKVKYVAHGLSFLLFSS